MKLISRSLSVLALRGLTAAALVALGTTAHAQFTYALDDGSGERSLGVTGGGTITFANQFNAVAGGETITTISMVFGVTFGSDFPNGVPVTINLWSDPNSDGDPTDAVVLSTLAGVSASVDTNTFVVYDIPDVTLGSGQSFFVGGVLTHAAGQFPLGIDDNSPLDARSYAAIGGSFSGGVINLNRAGIGDLMVRAQGNPLTSPVPEPGSIALLVGMASVGGIVLRRKAKK